MESGQGYQTPEKLPNTLLRRWNLERYEYEPFEHYGEGQIVSLEDKLLLHSFVAAKASALLPSVESELGGSIEYLLGVYNE